MLRLGIFVASGAIACAGGERFCANGLIMTLTSSVPNCLFASRSKTMAGLTGSGKLSVELFRRGAEP